jgi:hypothetical protein
MLCVGKNEVKASECNMVIGNFGSFGRRKCQDFSLTVVLQFEAEAY